MLAQFAAVGIGAAIGAWLRWGLGHLLNPTFPTLPLGTLAANLIGGFAMGAVMELVTRHTMLSPEARLFLATGLLGGLTTFSTFSAEVVTLLLRRELLWSVALITAHLVGSVLLTILGLLIARALLGRVA